MRLDQKGLQAPNRLLTRRQLGDSGGVGISAEVSSALEPAVPGLIRILKQDQEPMVRWVAVWALGQVGPPAKSAVPQLVEALESKADFGPPDGSFRQRAARSLGWIGEAGGIPALRKALDDPDPGIRRQAAAALSHMGKTNPRTVERVTPILVQALKHNDHWVRFEACDGLGEFGKSDALGPLEALKEDPDDMVRDKAKLAIQMIKERRQ